MKVLILAFLFSLAHGSSFVMLCSSLCGNFTGDSFCNYGSNRKLEVGKCYNEAGSAGPKYADFASFEAKEEDLVFAIEFFPNANCTGSPAAATGMTQPNTCYKDAASFYVSFSTTPETSYLGFVANPVAPPGNEPDAHKHCLCASTSGGVVIASEYKVQQCSQCTKATCSYWTRQGASLQCSCAAASSTFPMKLSLPSLAVPENESKQCPCVLDSKAQVQFERTDSTFEINYTVANSGQCPGGLKKVKANINEMGVMYLRGVDGGQHSYVVLRLPDNSELEWWVDSQCLYSGFSTWSSVLHVLIIAIPVGVGVGLLALIIILVVRCCKKKKTSSSSQYQPVKSYAEI